MMAPYDPLGVADTRHLFFTGKGGVGKTSIACATAVALADAGRRVLIVSTDPASNLADVFGVPTSGEPRAMVGVPNLWVASLDPMAEAKAYRESVIAPYRGVLPEAALENMAEQLSGSCTVEIAAFTGFARFLAEPGHQAAFDHIIFDTAPTGHTLRLLALPGAWTRFVAESTHGVSCLGQLSGLADRRGLYERAAATLADPAETVLVLVARAERTPLWEAARASAELMALGVARQLLVINGLMKPSTDSLASALYERQQAALAQMPGALEPLPGYGVFLHRHAPMGLQGLRQLFTDSGENTVSEVPAMPDMKTLDDLVESLRKNRRRVVFAMGKGGVGKTTIASAIATKLAALGEKVLLATTDPAAHLALFASAQQNLSLSHIDAALELERYRDEVMTRARENGLAGEALEYIEEDLRSPCTQEVAVFRAFAERVEAATDRTVVIDTAPTGHTLLLIATAAAYEGQMARATGETPKAVKNLMPRLLGGETEVVMVTLAEATPVLEAMRLEEDLLRANIRVGFWVVNRVIHDKTGRDALLAGLAAGQRSWLYRLARHAQNRCVWIGLKEREPSGKALVAL